MRIVTEAENVYSTQRNGAYLVRVGVGVRSQGEGVRVRVMNGAVPAGEQTKVGLAPEQSIAQVEEEGEEKEARGGPLRVHVRV